MNKNPQSQIPNPKYSIDPVKLPKHIAIIMDGNGRWAKKKGYRRIFGHQSAIEAVRETVEGAVELGIQFLTLYAFSTENWRRPQYEVDALMELLVKAIHDELATLMKNNIRLVSIGNIESLPFQCHKQLLHAIEETSHNKRMTLVIALSYSARWEIIQATKKIAEKALQKKIKSEDIDEIMFASELTTRDIPDPELLIRTSGEYRISNFLLWQIAYTELYFTEKLWPDFRKPDLHDAVIAYQSRERRFGMTSEQINLKVS